MGSGSSTCYKLPPPHADVPYFILMFQMPCGIRLGLADQATVEAVRRACYSVVNQNGIEFDGPLNDDSYKIRLVGTPFAPASDHKDALAARKIAARILQELYMLGWRLITSSDLSRSDDLSTWFFKVRASFWVGHPCLGLIIFSFFLGVGARSFSGMSSHCI